MKRTIWTAAAVLLGAGAAAPDRPPDPPVEFTVLITGGTVYDGTGADGVKADVGIAGDRIAAMGDLKGRSAKETIDATGRIVCPGFIDLHNHSDEPILEARTRANLSYLTQGCTMVVTGNCGTGHVDVTGYFGKLEAAGAGTHVAHLIPHGALRERAMGGSFNRPPTPAELDKMKALVDEAMKAGAVGMSTGLIYTPGIYAKTDEIVELAKVVAAHGGIYASHMRSEADHLLDAVKEALEIGRKAGCRVHISHLKASTPSAWGKVRDACALIEAAQKDGQTVTADQYPYVASSTGLAASTTPGWAREGSEKDILRRLDDPKDGPRIRKEIEDALRERGGADKVQIASFAKQPAWNGKTILALGKETGKEPADVVMDILRRGGAAVVNFSMCEEDVRYVMGKPYVATASDGSSKRPDATVPHPRAYGTFPRKIGRYAIELGVLPVAQAIRSASGLAADVLGLKDRGYLKAGQFADVVVFDPATFRDLATFEKPHQYSTGVVWLFVNGVATIADGKPTDALPGRVIRNPREPAASR